MNYNEAILYLESLQSTDIKLGLERVTRVLSKLSNPQERFKSVIVAGTNGKGSTCAFLESILRHGGFKTGLFLSPHLVDVRERIQINREMISERDFAGIAEKVVCHCEPRITYFEFLTAMAFLYFAENSVDMAVLEVGLGGRFDATNVVTPVVSAITRIGIDHQGYLGDTIEKIAFEKAGIIKEGVPVVTVVQDDGAMDVIRKVANEKNATLHVVGPNEVRYKLGLLGRHQNENAALAITAAELVGAKEHLAEALASTRWPGRLDVLSERPLVILDGAHNPNGAEALAKFIHSELKAKGKKVTILIGIMADKDITGIVDPLLKVADRIVVSRPDIPRAAATEKIRETIISIKPDMEVTCIEDVQIALKRTIKETKKDEALVIAGSLYMVGEVMSS